MKFKDQFQKIKNLKEIVDSYPQLKNYQVEYGYKYKNGQKTKELAIRIFVPKKRDKSDLGQDYFPSKINGIPTDIIECNYTKECHEYSSKTFVTKLVGGLEIENSYFNQNEGTIGCIVLKNNIPSILTCHHVLYGRAHNGIGGEIKQPARGNNYIGIANEYPSMYSRELDCAIFQLEDRMYSMENSLNGICGMIRNNKYPILDDIVFKYGRTTKLTYGIIEGIGLNNTFTIGKIKNSDSRLSAPGDSGSIWVTESGNHLRGIGLHVEGKQGKFALATNLVSIFRKLRITHISQPI